MDTASPHLHYCNQLSISTRTLQYGDGLEIPDRETKAQILSLLIEPLLGLSEVCLQFVNKTQ